MGRSPPHAAHLGADINADLPGIGPPASLRRRNRPGHGLKVLHGWCRNEARARRVDVSITLRILAVSKEAMGNDEMQTVFRAGHRDIKQPTLLLDFRCGAGAEIGRDTAIYHIEDKYRLPLLPLRGMDGRQNQIILIEQRNARLITGRVRRIERQLRQEPFAGRITRRDLLKLHEISLPQGGVLVHAFQMRVVPAPRMLDLRGPTRAAGVNVLESGNEGRPVLARSGGRRDIAKSSEWIRVVGPLLPNKLRRRLAQTRNEA